MKVCALSVSFVFLVLFPSKISPDVFPKKIKNDGTKVTVLNENKNDKANSKKKLNVKDSHKTRTKLNHEPKVSNAPAVISPSLARKLFGAPITYYEPNSSDIPIPVFVNSHNIGIELVKLTYAPDIQIDKMYTEMLLSDLEKLLKAEKFDEIRQLIFTSNLISKEELEEIGITPFYRMEDSSVDLQIPIDWLKPWLLNMNAFSASNLQPTVEAAEISGYINVHASELSSNSKIQIRDPFGMSVDGAVTAKGLTLQGGANYYNSEWNRTDTALVIPWNHGTHQVWVGDAIFSNSSAVSYPQLSGISYFKKATYSDSHFEVDGGVISVKNPSTIQIYKNEALYKTLNVGPGSFHLTDLPLDLGSNTIRIVIKDESTGEITEKIISDFLPIHSVPSGDWEHVVSYGSKRSIGIEGVHYYGNPVAFFGFMYGLARTLNGGLNFYSSNDFYKPSETIRAFTKVGNFSLTTSESFKTNPSISGLAVKGEYQTSRLNSKIINVLSLSEEVSSPGYLSSEGDKDSEAARTVSINVGLKPILKISSSFGFSNRVTGNTKNNSSFVNIGKNFQINRHWRLAGTAGQLWSDLRGSESRFMVSLNYNESFDDSAVTSYVRKTQDGQYLGASYRDKDLLELQATAQQGSRFDKNTYVSASAKKTFPRAILNASATDNGAYQSLYTELHSGIAFTNKTFAITKPISSSFIIFTSENKSGVEFDVTNEGGMSVATSGSWLKSIAVPVQNFSRGLYSGSFVDPEYYTLESSKSAIFMPEYKEGTHVFLHSEERMITTGVLVDEAGKPYLNSIVTISCKQPDAVLATSTFTNNSGEFQFLVKRNSECRLTLGSSSHESDILDLSWPVHYKDLGPVTIKQK